MHLKDDHPSLGIYASVQKYKIAGVHGVWILVVDVVDVNKEDQQLFVGCLELRSHKHVRESADTSNCRTPATNSTYA
jgi:hypothetical protein